MKKMLQLTVACAIAFCFMLNVNAATEQELIDHVSKYYTIAGEDVRIDDIYLNRFKSILAEKEVSESAAQTIMDDFDKSVAILQAANQKDPTKLNKADRQELLRIGQHAAAQLELNVTYRDGKLYIVGFDGKEYPPVEVRFALVGIDKLKSTGNDYTVYVAVSSLAIAVIAVAGYRKLKGNA